MSYRQLLAIYLVSTACFVCVWLLGGAIGQAEEAAVTVEIASTPPLEHIRPNTDLARLTLTALLHGKPLGQGHMKVQLTAPPRTKILATGFPRVEGTPLLALDSELTDGNLTLQYRTRPQGAWEGVWWFSVEPGEVGLTALEGAGDGINQHAKDRLAQLTAGLAQR